MPSARPLPTVADQAARVIAEERFDGGGRAVGRISGFLMRDILRHLDAALASAVQSDPVGSVGSAPWHLRMAHGQLTDAAMCDVAVELMQGAA